MAKRKWYKVVILQKEMVPTIQKYVYVNVKRCFIKNGEIHIRRREAGYMYPGDCEFFVKEQKGWIDDGSKKVRKSRKKKKSKVA